MYSRLIVFISLCLFFILKAPYVFAENNIVINEFLIDPSPQTVELFNPSAEVIDISGWYLDDGGGTTYYTVAAGTTIYPHSCLIFTHDLNLNKTTSDSIRLFNNTASPTSADNQLVDSYSYTSSPGTGVSFFRSPDGTSNWTSGQSNLGKLNQTGENCIITPTPTPSPSPNITPTETPIPTDVVNSPTLAPTEITPPTQITHIFISEVLPYPLTGTSEWIELFNDNEFSVSLLNWYVDDVEDAGSSPKVFSVQIEEKGYAIVELSSSIFNNDGDAVRLLDQDKSVKDTFEYSKAHQDKSFGRVAYNSDAVCEQIGSKGFANYACDSPTPTPSSTPTPYLTPSKSPTPSPKISVVKNISVTLSPFRSQLQYDTETILGAQTKSGHPNNPFKTSSRYPLLKSLTFASFSYSLLTILAVILRMFK